MSLSTYFTITFPVFSSGFSSGFPPGLELIVKYNIKITNKGELGGTSKIVENIPEGYEIAYLPSEWKTNKNGITLTTSPVFMLTITVASDWLSFSFVSL